MLACFGDLPLDVITSLTLHFYFNELGFALLMHVALQRMPLSLLGQELPMAHVIDRNGRHAGIFHGSDFSKTNLTLYINQLINNAHAPKPPAEKGWWEWLTGWF